MVASWPAEAAAANRLSQVSHSREAAAKPAKPSGAVSPNQNMKEAEKAKVKFNRNGSCIQKGSNDPIRDGVGNYEEELDSVSSSKRNKGKNKSKS